LGTTSSIDVGVWPRAACAAGALLCALIALACLLVPARAQALEGINKIQHVVMIMQENRSMDNYFGTYPGANGIPAGTCVPDPVRGGCVTPTFTADEKSEGGPHGTEAAIGDIDGGKMDGFVAEAEAKKECSLTGGCPKCKKGAECVDQVVGYHDARDLPNYWNYAQDFVLQDNLFESQASWSLPEHLALVSGWSAVCSRKEPENPLACASSLNPAQPAKYWASPLEPGRTTYPWTDITYLLDKAGVSWRYYMHEGAEPDCEDDESESCEKVKQEVKTPGIWNPLADFSDVKQDGQLGNIQALSHFYEATGQPGECGLPNVSWIVPDLTHSEHPPSQISVGEAYVTTLINTIMRSPCWGSTAIFLSWDDWGGYYDHVVPPDVDENGYGLRVPGLVISPYAKAGYIDHQQLSHDAYLKFIEDDFLGGSRLNPKTDGRPDSRPFVREEAAGLGSLLSDFNFNQSPRPPLLLSPHPAAGPASQPPGAQKPPAVELEPANLPSGTVADLSGTVNPDGGEVKSCHFEYGIPPAYESSVPCSKAIGAGTAPVEASAVAASLSPTTTYHFRLVAANSGGTSTGPELMFTTSSMAPTAETLPATGLAQTSATLNATVNPNGANVSECLFEYGPTSSYGKSVPCSTAPGSGKSPVAVSGQVSSLSPGTAYHFRILARSAVGTGYGADLEFNTPSGPVVSGVAPDAGLTGGGTEVTITGSGFSGSPTVLFGTAAASAVVVRSPTSITAVSPQGSGTVDVTVREPGGTSPTGNADLFTYVKPGAAPSVNGIEPASGPSAGGTTVTVTGKRFSGVTGVLFGSTPAAGFTVSSSESIQATAPPGAPGAVQVVVVTPNGASKSTKNSTFTYTAGAALAGSELAVLTEALAF
jgi:phospholipase C